jgi:hypothetical protein
MGTAKKIGKKLESNVKSLGRKLDKSIIQPVVKTVKTIVKDPRALAGVALTMAFPGAGAFLGAKLGLGSGLAAKTVGNVLLKTALNGGNVKAAVISSAIPLLGQSAGNLIGKTLDSSGITGSLNNVITKAATGGLTAAALGKDPVAAMTFGGISAALPLVTAQIPGFGDLPDAAKSALTKTLTAQLTGKDPSQALFQSVIDSGVKTANQYLKPELGFGIPEGLFQAPGQPPQGMRRPPSRMDQQFKPFKMEDRSPPAGESSASGIAALLPPPPPKKEEAAPASAEPQSLGNFEDFIGGFAGSGGSMGYLGAGGSGYPGDSYSDYGYAGGDEYSYRDGSSGRGGEGAFSYEMFDTGSGAGAGDFTGSNAADFGALTDVSPAAQPAAPSEPVPFGKAFAQARLGGAKTFEWQGKSYTTELAASPKPATSAASPAVPSPVRSAQPPAAPDSVGGGRGVQGGPTAEELAAYASSQGDTGPFVGYGNAFKVNPQTYKDINDVNDPKTLAFVSGLMGTAPDRLGYSVLNPNAEGIRKAGTAGFAAGTAAQIAPAAAGLRAALPSMRGPSALENYLAQSAGSTDRGLDALLASNRKPDTYAAPTPRTVGDPARLSAASRQFPQMLDQLPYGPKTKSTIDKATDLANAGDTTAAFRLIESNPATFAAMQNYAGNLGFRQVSPLPVSQRLDSPAEYLMNMNGELVRSPVFPTQRQSASGIRGTYDPFDAKRGYAKGGMAKKSKSRNQLGIMALAVKRGLV